MRVSEFITSFRLSLRYCSTYETITSYRTILGFSLLRPELQGIMFIYIGIHVSERTFAKSEDRRGGREGRSLDNALDDVAINRAEQKRDERRGTRYRGACIPLCSLAPLGCTPCKASDVLHRSHHRSKVLPIHAIGPSI